MKYIFGILIILIFGSCIDRAKMPVDEVVYASDKQLIAKYFIDNVEYFRRCLFYESDSIAYLKHYQRPESIVKDWAWYYMPYARRYLKNHLDDTFSPLPTESQIEVTVDTIIYNKTGDLFVAFICIENHFCSLPNTNSVLGYISYDSHAMIGYRDHFDNVIKVYPLSEFNYHNMVFRNQAVSLLKFEYMHYLILQSLGRHKNVGAKDFFEKSEYFQKNDSGEYLFQMKYHNFDKGKSDYPYGN